MTNPSDLLRLLEPAVRPVGGGTSGKPESAPTFEGKSFDQLLTDAQQPRDAEPRQGEAAAQTTSPPSDNPTPPAALPGLGSIENASLARLLASRPAANPELTQ